jgi:hypothetical protein
MAVADPCERKSCRDIVVDAEDGLRWIAAAFPPLPMISAELESSTIPNRAQTSEKLVQGRGHLLPVPNLAGQSSPRPARLL